VRVPRINPPEGAVCRGGSGVGRLKNVPSSTTMPEPMEMEWPEMVVWTPGGSVSEAPRITPPPGAGWTGVLIARASAGATPLGGGRV